jgi:hypothetical protein
LPFVVLLEQNRPGQAHDRRIALQDPDDAGAAFHFMLDVPPWAFSSFRPCTWENLADKAKKLGIQQ